MSKSSWRLIPLLEAPGQFQMNLDGWLIKQHRLGNHPPCLRFYTWSSATLSLGYHQKRHPLFWENLVWQGKSLDLVRRPTGGRAVLHQGDLSYMVVTSEISGNRLEVYQHICEFLLLGWRSLGVDLHYGEAGRGYIHNPNCFGTATGADLVDKSGCKLIGSAQLKQGKGILQHGSMMLNPDRELYREVFGEDLACVSHLLEPFEVIKALTEAAMTCFQMDLITQPLSPAEWLEVEGFNQKQK